MQQTKQCSWDKRTDTKTTIKQGVGGGGLENESNKLPVVLFCAPEKEGDVESITDVCVWKRVCDVCVICV